MMRIVNLKDKPACPYIYVGRRMGPREGSPLGNPFKVGKHRDPIALYRAWLWEKIKAQDQSVMALLNFITEESVLACYCVNLEGEAIFTEPERCHGQLIWKAWRYLRETA